MGFNVASGNQKKNTIDLTSSLFSSSSFETSKKVDASVAATVTKEPQWNVGREEMKNIKGTKFRKRYASETMSAPSSSACSSQNSSTMEFMGKMGHPSSLKQAQIGAKVPSVFSSDEVSFKEKTNQLIKDDKEVLTKLKTLIRQQQRVCSENTENYRDMLLTTQLGRTPSTLLRPSFHLHLLKHQRKLMLLSLRQLPKNRNGTLEEKK